MTQYEMRVEYMEPCEDCGKGEPNPLYILDGKMVILCDRCFDERAAQAMAAKERARLAEWGTLRDKRVTA